MELVQKRVPSSRSRSGSQSDHTGFLPVRLKNLSLPNVSLHRTSFIHPLQKLEPFSNPSQRNYHDDRRSSTASILSIFTFGYAVFIGWCFFLKATRRSPEQIQRLLASLDTSYREMRMIGDSLMNQETFLAREAKKAKTAEFESDATPILIRVEHQFQSLMDMTEKISREENGSRIKQWYNWSRFVLMQEELTQKVAEKDQLMEDLRRVQNRYDKREERYSHEYTRQQQEYDQKNVRDMLMGQLVELRTTQKALQETLTSAIDIMYRAQKSEATAAE